ncbi:MAG: bifunctional demethylmenaquinone methyltransferase/2-methoxy-6-polyprenyl-1,4-benzoquinol methylase UbiE [Catalinimonas sp.]
MTVLPYEERNDPKKQQVADMFDAISPRYDFLNHTLSLGIDRYWRSEALKMLRSRAPRYLLDVATGTADFAIQALTLKPDRIIGVDISEGMLDVGRRKLRRASLDDRIELRSGDSEKLPFADNEFDAVIVAFGVRNFENLEAGLRDIRRVLKPGGAALILEFSQPRGAIGPAYQAYFRHVLPKIGQWVSGDSSAYTYLPESVAQFPEGGAFLQILEATGFHAPVWRPLTFGIASAYLGQKPS